MTAPTLLGPEFADEVEALLDQLGDTPKAVGEYLTAQGVKGTPDSLEDCPIAVYLRSCGYDICEVETGASPRVVFGGVQVDDRWHFPMSALLSQAVRRFAIEFDHEKWPQLVRAEVAS